MNNLIKRLPVIILGIPSVLYLVQIGGAPFSIIVTIVLLLCSYEFLALTKKIGAGTNLFSKS